MEKLKLNIQLFASIGLRTFRYAPMNEDEETYGEVGTLAGAIECKVSLNIANAKLRSDDVTKENIDEFIDGTITMGVDDDEDAIFSPLLGEKTEEYQYAEGKKVTVYKSNSEDSAKYLGFGQIVPKIQNRERVYKVEWFPKIQFKPYVTDKKTKGDSLEFTTPSIEGTVFVNKDNDWRKRATFDNEKDANAFLDSLFVQKG